MVEMMMTVEVTAVARWARRWRLAVAWTVAAVVVVTATGGGHAVASVL